MAKLPILPKPKGPLPPGFGRECHQLKVRVPDEYRAFLEKLAKEHITSNGGALMLLVEHYRRTSGNDAVQRSA